MTRATDIAVVGAGVVGALIAMRLAEAGVTTTLLESEFAGSGATAAAMGHVVVMDDSPAQLALCTLSRQRWDALRDDLPERGEYQRSGTLWLAANDDELAVAAVRRDAYAVAGVESAVIDAAALYRLEPHLRPGLAGALHVPGDGVCYPPAIARWMCDRARDAGAIVRDRARVRQIRAHELQCDDGTTVRAAAIVVAAGAASPALIEGLPIVPRRGHLVITSRCPGLVSHQLVELGYLASAHTFGGASVAFNVQPRKTGQALIGSSRELVGLDTRINRPLLGAMMRRAIAFLPALAQVSALRSWIGFRPATPDKLPLIGAWPKIPGAWIAAGHEGLGITMATGTADLIVAGLLERTPPIDPAPFRPDRPMPALAHAA